MSENSAAALAQTTRFHSIAKRFVLALTLIPIVPATSTIALAIAETTASPASGTFDSVWWFHSFLTVFWMAGLLLVFRTAILWTLGRGALTALVSLLPFVQIVINEPLWQTKGCGLNFDDMFLRSGQHYAGCGLWTWLVVWVWWGLEKRSVAMESSVREKAHRSPWLARLGASMGMFPVILGVFVILTIFLNSILNLGVAARPTPFWEFLFCGILVLVGWCLIWRKVVRWSDGVFTATCGAWALFIGAPISLLFFGLGGGTTTFWEVVLTCLPVIGWGIWMAWTMWYWPFRTLGLAGDGPQCEKCGYSLQGLTATRCPECGDEPTLDQLWAANRALRQ